MSVQKSTPNDIRITEGNSLSVFIDNETNKLSVKDSNGIIQTVDDLVLQGGITQIIAGTCITGGGTTPTVTINHASTSTLNGDYGHTGVQNGCYIKSVTVDELGHLTGITSDNFDTRYLGINNCAVDSALLNTYNGSYYLDFCNFTNVPPLGDITSVCAGDGLGGGGDSGVVTLFNTDKGSSQSIIKNVSANTGGFTASTNNDSLVILGSGDLSTSITGNTLTISSSTPLASNCQIQILASDGLNGNATFTLNQNTNSSFSFTNSDKGSSQNIFKNISVSGQNTITASSNNDTFSLVEGANIQITTNEPTNQITISNTNQPASDCQIQITASDGLTGNATFTLNQTTNGSFNITNADKGSSQCFFQSIEVIGSCTVTAEQNNDTLCLSAGTGITLTSDNTQDLITIGTTATSCTGTVTSVGATTGTTGTDFNISGSPVTTSGIITFNLPSASATNRGALTSADWSAFNSKTDCTGTVTSIAVNSTETGSNVSVTGSPITTSGIIDINIPIASATATGKLTSTDWSDFNNKVDDVTAGTGISVSGTDTIEVTNTDLGSSQCIFKNFAVTGQNTVVAESNNDTLTFVGSGIAITTDDTTDTMTFTVTDAGGTVTSVGLDTGTTGTDINVSNSPITTSGNITINIPTASATNRGALSSADWTTFNNKSTCIGTVTSVTVNGGEGIVSSGSPITTSGAINVALCLNELSTSIDNTDGCFFAVVSALGVQTKLNKSYINLTGFNNDAVFTTCTGTVSSISLSNGGGLSISGSPITGAGTIILTNSDKGSSQNIFKNFAVSGQNTVVADNNNDTLTLIAGTNVSITTDATGDSITINSSTQGDITGVTAGNGLTGGGTTGTVTLNVGAGTGIDVSADAISVDVSDFMTNGANNRVVTATGTDTMTAESNLTYDGVDLSVCGQINLKNCIVMNGIDFDNVSVKSSGGNVLSNFDTQDGVFSYADNNIEVGSTGIDLCNNVSIVNKTLRVGGTDNSVTAGTNSMTGGNLTCVTSAQSIGFGYCNQVLGGASAVFGAVNISSGGNNFIAGGQLNCTSGQDAFASGFCNRPSGSQAFAIGYNSCASGNSSFAGGGGSFACNLGAFVYASGSITNGVYSATFGSGNSNLSNYGFVAGFGNALCNISTCSVGGNAVFGSSNRVVRGGNSLVVGGSNCFCQDTYASGGTQGGAIMFGYCNEADGESAMSLTGGNCSDNFSTSGIAIGCGATASRGLQQYAFGCGTTTPTSGTCAYGSNQFVVGQYNVFSTSGRVHLFAVGSGTSDLSRNNALNVDTLGRVGIGTIIPSYQLQLSTNSAAKPSSSTWTVISDERVKENIQPYQKGLNEIIQINTKTFDYNGKAGFDKIKNNVGVVAQEIIKVFPETIKTYSAKLDETDEEETELYNFDAHPLTFALINSVKELNDKILLLENEIKNLQSTKA